MTTLTKPAEAATTAKGTWHLSRQLRENAARLPDRVALREKRHGIWRDITWSDYLANTEMVAYALAALGVGPTDRVAIQSENRPEWLYTDIACNMLRAVIVGFYSTNPVAEIRYLLSDSGAKVIISEDQEQVDKALEVIDEVDTLEWIVYLDSRGLSDYDDPRLISLDEAIARGAALRATDPDLLERVDAQKTPDDLITLIYTSGTTGPPKGAMLSADNIAYGTDVFAEDDGMFGSTGLTDDDVVVSYLPLSHVLERSVTTWGGLRNATIVHFAESIETVVSDLGEVQPTVLAAVPRIWEKIQATIAIRMANATPLKRFVYGISDRLGRKAAKARLAAGGAHTASSRILTFIAWMLAGRKLRRHLGLAKVRMAISGAAPISVDVLESFLGLGVLIHEAYGMTENTAVATANRPGRVKLGTVGEAQPGIELTLDPETGEVLTRHRGNFIGYWNQPSATADVFTKDGWLRTGDVGEWVDGTHLKIVDRIKDIIITAGGKNISPSEIENAIKASPYVREAVVIGDKRPYLTAIIGIEFDTVADWASRRRIEYTTYRDLSSKPEVIELIADVVRDVNTRFARVEAVRKIRMLAKELDHEDGELTATQKLKRRAFAATVQHLIDDMYAGTTEYPGADLGRSG
ncbi:MAG: long-chain fatty acid--CoA ligase [Actinomycetales bacterium]|nr:long-chain fatty acid--CoA ligase [Actinomycetales bacterium]